MTLDQAATALPEMMLAKFGALLPVDQVDLVECEDKKSVMAYCYTATDHCIMISFAKPANYDAAHCRAVLLAPHTVH